MSSMTWTEQLSVASGNRGIKMVRGRLTGFNTSALYHLV